MSLNCVAAFGCGAAPFSAKVDITLEQNAFLEDEVGIRFESGACDDANRSQNTGLRGSWACFGTVFDQNLYILGSKSGGNWAFRLRVVTKVVKVTVKHMSFGLVVRKASIPCDSGEGDPPRTL